MRVRLGEHDTKTDVDLDSESDPLPPIQDILIEKAIRHKQFDYRNKLNDIALLRLKTAADLSKENVNTICLPTTEDSQIDQLQKTFLDKMIIAGDY